MKEFKGTKGNWEYKVMGARIAFENPNMDLWFKETDNCFDNTKQEAEANAKLIANAKELLRLAQLVHGSFGGGSVITFSEKDMDDYKNVLTKILD